MPKTGIHEKNGRVEIAFESGRDDTVNKDLDYRYRSADKIQAGRLVWTLGNNKKKIQTGTTTLASTRGLAFLLYASKRAHGGSEGSDDRWYGFVDMDHQMWVSGSSSGSGSNIWSAYPVKTSGGEKHLAHRNNRLTQRTACTACSPTVMQAIM